MSLRLSSAEIAAIERATSVLLAPFSYEDGESWRRAAAHAIADCVGADASSFQLVLPGMPIIAADPDVARALEAMDPLPPDWVVEALTVRRRTLGLTVTDWEELFDASQVRTTDFYNDIVRPQRLLAPITMLKGLRESPLPASLSVYFDNESSAHRQAARRKEILRLLYAAYCAGLRAYLALRQNAAALKRLADDVSIGVLRFDKVGRVVSENEFFQRLMCTDPNRDFVRSEIVRKVHGLIAIATHASTQRQMSFDFPTRAGRYRVLPAFLNGVSGEDCGCLIALVERFRPQRMTTTEIASRFSLTQRELECALLLSHGLSSRDMAQRLGISINTARRHVERIFLKLDVHNRVAAVAKLTALSLFWFLGDLGELLTMSTVC